MTPRFAKLLPLLLGLSFSACHSSMKTPDIKHNPHPKMRYEITLTIQDAPGPFESVSGFMQYEVTNKRCSPENPISGTWGQRPITSVPFTFTRVSDQEYKGEVYLDMLLDEDYFGLGVCHWAMTFAVATLEANKMTFSPAMAVDRIATQQSETEYFPKKAYLDNPIPGRSMGGLIAGTPAAAYMEQHPDEFFSATLTAREEFQ